MNRLLRVVAILGIVFSLLAFSFPAQAAAPADAADFAQDHILVKFKADTDTATQRDVHNRHKRSVDKEDARLAVQIVKIPVGKVQEEVAAYRGEKAVQFAEPDYIARAIGTPNDTYFAQQWGLTKVQAPQAWDITTGSASIPIAILDTGVDQNHPDLSAKIIANQNFTTSSTADDMYGHGTHVAGISAAITNNGAGVAGMGYNSSIMNVKVLDDSGSGSYSWVASGIAWAADHGAKVISMSLGGSSSSSTLQSAVDYAWSKGVVIVAAAGNSKSTALSYPGAYSNVISVAATDQNDAKASFSTYGTWVDVAAPGVNIFSTLPTYSNAIGATNYGYLSGTSMATPFVSGLAALVWSTPYGTSNISVRNRIQSTADAIGGTGSYWQYGRINAYKAVQPSAPDFSLSASPSSQTVAAGGSASYSVTVNPINGFSGPVTLSVSGLPAGATASFGTNPTTTSSTLSVTTTSSTPAGTYSLTITGVSGSLTHSAMTTLGVTAPDFSLSASPSSQTVAAGGSASYSVTVNPINGFSGPVTLSVSGLPAGATASFGTNPTTTSSTLSVTTTSSTPAGTYSLTITGVSGSLTHTTTATLVVGNPSFTLSVSPTSRTVRQGKYTSYTVNIAPTGGFTGAVTLTVSGLPGSTVASFSPNPASTSSTLLVTTNRSTPTGTYTLTITGVSGALTISTTAALTVRRR